ncbi:MAG: hypothetical protein PWP31_929 [Clostridia bacterium]|nr:hypothetical protein [Clostridia bacterium]
MIAKDIMSTNLIMINANAKIYELTKLLADNHISGVPVYDESNNVVGMVSEADLIGLKNGNCVRDIMNTEIVGVDVNTPVEKVASILNEKKIKRVPVYANGSVVGIISRADIVAAMAKEC